uniref:G-protein coupled receptors family 1 profile domain-containing protein n=1 Tax=Meloidogyne javanica TaxID=6303 RepID=A0A915LC07_MELJA
MEEQSTYNCHYEGTEYIEVKFILIGVFASGLALISFLLNAFLVLVFALNPKLGRSPLFYFGVLAILDLALAMLYIALMAVPAYMDKFKLLWLYHLFVSYLRPMLTFSNFAVFASVLMILLATTERLLLTFEGKQIKKARKILERNRRQVTLFNINKIEDQTQKKNLRAATRALISVVSMYLMSKVLQVAVTFFETFSPERLTEEEFRPIYSYANDIIPILTLLSSTLRFPIYCVCNKPMLIATR